MGYACFIYLFVGMIISGILATAFSADKQTWVGVFIFLMGLCLLLVFAKILTVNFIIQSILKS